MSAEGLRRFWPRSLAALVALLLLGGAFAYVFSEETPLGAVKGRVILAENGKPLPEAEITLTPTGYEDDEEGPRHHRYALSDAEGNFSIRHIPAGSYYISASSKSHRSADSYLSIDEGQTTPLEMAATRSAPEFKLNQDQRIFATNEPARVGVTGYVDTKKEAAKQPDLIRVSLWRTRLSNILQDKGAEQAFQEVGRGYDRALTLPAALLNPSVGPAPEKILEKDFPVTGADREGFFHQRMPFEALKPGVYLVSLSHAEATDCTWMLVTDTALVTKRVKDQVVAYTVDMRTGQPLSDSTVRAYRGGRVIADAQTDGNGIANLHLARTGPKRPSNSTTEGGEEAEGDSESGDSARITTVAIRGADEAVVARNYYRNEGEGQYALHAYTDRPIYRPGQRIYFKGIARRRNELPPNPGFVDGHVRERYSVPANMPVKVEIRDPSGDRILQQNVRLSSYGSFYGQVDLDREAPTGVYSMITTIGGEEKTHDIVIASYRKPEYAVKVTPDKKRYARGDTVNMTVDAQYFFGAPLVGAVVKYHVYREHDYSAEYSDPADAEDQSDTPEEGSSYESGGESYYGATVTDGETRLDENGKAVISFVAKPPDDPEGPQADQYTVSVTVKEGEGREQQADGIAHVVTGDFRLDISAEGYMAAPGQAVPVTITAKDHDGNPVPNVAVELETGYHTWKLGEYSYTKVGVQQAVTGSDGKASLTVTAPKAGELRLKGRAWDSHRHKIVGRDYLWITDDAGGDLDTEYSDLSLHPDKKHYNPGDTARVLVNAARTGETVLLTIEGERIYHIQTLAMTQKSMVVRLPVRAEYGPNIYLGACYVRDKKFASSEAPLRVSMPQKQINVQITADRDPQAGNTLTTAAATGSQRQTPNAPLARYSPGDTITYQVRTTDATGKPLSCEFSFGVVDEAIYALKEDSPNALRDSFYPHRMNSVQTEYSFAIAYMGDADKSEPQMVTRKRFPDVAYWKPDLMTDAQGRATISFQLQDSLTTWRATATAHTTDTRLGRAVEKVISAKDFLVRVQTPRFLTQHDKSRIVALVHNDTGSPQSATVKIEASGINLDSQATQQVTIDPGKHSEVVWAVSAESIGDAKISVKAWTPKSANGVQYTDGMDVSLPVKAHGREFVTAKASDLAAGGQLTQTVMLDPNAIPGVSRLTIRITPSIASSLLGATDYLIGFPYGCTEQTMSRFLPDLLVQRALRLNGLRDVKHAEELPRMVKRGLQRLYRFQHADTGGWGWWEHDKDDPWMTAYVLYGLATAQAEGYPVSQNVLTKGRKAALAFLQQPDTTIAVDAPAGTTEKQVLAQNDRAFLLYALALAGDQNSAAAGRIDLKISALSSQSLGYLILLNRLLGEPPDYALEELSKRAVTTDGMVHWKTGRWASWDWDDQTTNATLLRALLAVNRNDPRITDLLRWLMLQRTGEYWSSTRDTTWVLAAFCDYLSAQSSWASNGDVQISVNGQPYKTLALTPDLLREQEVVLRVPLARLRSGANTITFQRTGGNSLLFTSVELRQTIGQEDIPALTRSVSELGLSPQHGLPEPPAMPGPKTENPNGKLEIKREYLRVLPKKAGSDSWSLQTEPTNNQLQEGDRIRVRLTINVPREMAYVLIEDPFPSGCEVTERGTAEEVVEWGYWWDSADVRDDKIAFFAKRLSPGQHVIEYNLRAMTHGSYHVLPTLLQGMYAPESRAESAESRVTVR